VPLSFSLIAAAPPEIYTLSLHDALPIYERHRGLARRQRIALAREQHVHLHAVDVVREAEAVRADDRQAALARHLLDLLLLVAPRSEEHTSELQSLAYLVCRLLLEKKNRT